MEFTVKQPALFKELEILQGVVERKNTVPILANVLISATGEGLELMGTDLQVSVRSRSQASVKIPGAVCVSAKKLFEIVRLLPDKDIVLRTDAENWLSIVCERSRFRVMGLAKDDFPTLPSPEKSTRVKIPGPLFRKLIERVLFAVTSDDARFALNGALLILKDKSISLVASDGHRLAHVTDTLDARGPSEEERVLIPRKALSEIARIAGDLEEDVFYCRKENHLFFEIGSCLLTSRVLEGTFPNFEKVIPVGNDKIVEFEREELMAALTRVSVLANERSRAIRFAVKGGNAEISSKNPEMGDASEVIPVDDREADIEIGFNAKYLLDFLAVTGTARVKVELKDEATQGVLRPAGEESASYTYVVMPMRL